MTEHYSTTTSRSNQPIKTTMYGIGYNLGGKHPSHKDGRISKEYSVWASMMRRCYSDRDRAMFPAYKNCTVHPDWHNFQVFAEWYTNHKYYGLDYCLDKDLLDIGNTIYSEEKCTLVPHLINTILLNVKSRRGNLPQGVYFDKANNKYKSQISIGSKVVSLGRFKDLEDAVAAYKEAKERYVKNIALEWANRIEWGVFKNLMLWAVAKPDSYSEPDLAPFL